MKPKWQSIFPLQLALANIIIILLLLYKIVSHLFYGWNDTTYIGCNHAMHTASIKSICNSYYKVIIFKNILTITVASVSFH